MIGEPRCERPIIQIPARSAIARASELGTDNVAIPPMPERQPFTAISPEILPERRTMERSKEVDASAAAPMTLSMTSPEDVAELEASVEVDVLEAGLELNGPGARK